MQGLAASGALAGEGVSRLQVHPNLAKDGGVASFNRHCCGVLMIASAARSFWCFQRLCDGSAQEGTALAWQHDDIKVGRGELPARTSDPLRYRVIKWHIWRTGGHHRGRSHECGRSPTSVMDPLSFVGLSGQNAGHDVAGPPQVSHLLGWHTRWEVVWSQGEVLGLGQAA